MCVFSVEQTNNKKKSFVNKSMSNLTFFISGVVQGSCSNITTVSHDKYHSNTQHACTDLLTCPRISLKVLEGIKYLIKLTIPQGH